jgi:LysM repeat protein
MRPLAALLLALLVFAPRPAAAQELLQRLAEAERVARLEAAFAKDPELRRYAFQVTADRAVVTVAGTVQTPEERQRVQRLADNIGEIGSLVNRVQVEGAPPIPVTAPPRPVAAAPEPAENADSVAAAPVAAAPTPEAKPEPEPEATYHRVRSGDTLGKIARQYGTSIREVQRLNNMRSTRIRAGQRLRVK